MKIILSAILLATSLNLFAASEVLIKTRKECQASYESSIKNFLSNEYHTKKCAAQDARIFGEIECEQKNGQVNEQTVSNITCETKIFYHMNTRYNRTICQARALTSCALK